MSEHDEELRHIMRELAERFPMQDGWPTALKAEYMAVVRRFPLATAVRPVYEILMTVRRTMPDPETLARDLQREVDALNRPAKSCRHCDAESPGFVLVYGARWIGRRVGLHVRGVTRPRWVTTGNRTRCSVRGLPGVVYGPIPPSVRKLLERIDHEFRRGTGEPHRQR